MRDFLAAIGNAYRLLWTGLYQLGQPWLMWGGFLLIGGWASVSSGRPTDALPYLFMWGIVAGGARLLVNGFLPLPPGRRVAPLPSERTPPPAQPAVIVTPAVSPEACPPPAEMRARLPASLQALLR